VLATITSKMTPGERRASGQRQIIGSALVGAWWGGLAIVTPLYWPYPRLLLPVLSATWLGVAILIDLLLRQGRERALAGIISVLAISGAVTGLGWLWASKTEGMGEDRAALAQIAAKLRGDIDGAATAPAAAPSMPTRVVYVFGEPAMFFQLRAAGEAIVAPAQNIPATPATIEGRAAPTFLIAGPHAQRDPQFLEQWEAAKEQWELIQAFNYQPSAVVWLDLHDPRQPMPAATSLNQVRLYRLRSGDSGP
jgi:dolichyl-phosphate-mannose-protein mannosyltransferase